MKLQKQLSRKVGNKTYSKYVVAIPQKTIETLKWKGGDELEFDLKSGKIVIKKRTN